MTAGVSKFKNFQCMPRYAPTTLVDDSRTVPAVSEGNNERSGLIFGLPLYLHHSEDLSQPLSVVETLRNDVALRCHLVLRRVLRQVFPA